MDMGKDICMDMRKDICMNTCRGMRVDMRIDMCIDMCIAAMPESVAVTSAHTGLACVSLRHLCTHLLYQPTATHPAVPRFYAVAAARRCGVSARRHGDWA